MRECFQFEGMSILDHGLSVREWYEDLLRYLRGHGTQLSWRMPTWIDDPLVKTGLSWVNPEQARLYQVYHDCGKPLCRTVDDQGRQHFPDHCERSRERWLECSDRSEAAQYVGRLIGMDMLAHTLAPTEFAPLMAEDSAAIVLLLTALSELHSNAQMFGGTDSTSFKIKFKRLEKSGRRLIEVINGK